MRLLSQFKNTHPNDWNGSTAGDEKTKICPLRVTALVSLLTGFMSKNTPPL